eukprot:2671800-Heterocapsa_arctica.AAC.1
MLLDRRPNDDDYHLWVPNTHAGTVGRRTRTHVSEDVGHTLELLLQSSPLEAHRPWLWLGLREAGSQRGRDPWRCRHRLESGGAAGWA